MKLYLIAAMLLIGISTSAQVVNIPDPAFKAYLVGNPSINTNVDNEIQITEALAVDTLLISSPGITDLTGIRSFANLESFQASDDNITSLDLSGMQQLIEIYTSSNQSLSQINISGCINLKTLFAVDCNLSALDVSGCINLEGLDCSNNNLSTLDVSNCSHLKDLRCSYNNLNNITFGVLDSLTSLTLNGNFLTSLDLRNCPNLYSIDCSDMSMLASVNASGLAKLTLLSFFSNGGVADMNLSGCSSLINASLNDDPLTSLDVSGCTSLESLSVLSGEINNLDLSSCISLKSLYVGNFVPININLKNGRMLTEFFFLDHGQQDTFYHICADEFEVDTLLSYFSSNSNAFVSSYCSFLPGGHHNTIKGKASLDLNSNGCDPADAGMPSVPVRMTDASGASVIRYTFFNGEYAHYPYAGNFTLTPYFPYPYFAIAPTSANIAFDTANSLIDSANFCIAPSGIYNDLEITLLPVTPARPGFDAGYQLIYKNRGTTTLSGALQLNFDYGKMNFISASAGVSSQSAGQRTWNFNNILPFERRTIDITFNILPPPLNNINDTLIFLAAINPAANDETPNDNNFVLPQAVTGSYDPNDKLCLEGSKIALTDIDKPLHYIIHFQNLGTDTAFNIVVADTLSNKLDWNSFEFTGSSHTCNVQQRNGKMEFFFQNINLPHAAINEPASHGFVAFKIKPKADVIIGDSLNNRAAIYFDFNLPVITNMATTVVSPVGPVPVRLEYFSAAAKGNANILKWKAACTDGTSTFMIERSSDGVRFTKIGSITATHTRCQLPFYFTDEHPIAGKNYYRIKITDADGATFYTRILLIETNKSGFTILAVVNNYDNATAYLNSSEHQVVQLKVMAGDGKVVYNHNQKIEKGNSKVNLNLQNLASGIYTLVAYTNKGEVITRRFMK